ncbi:MAG TPA: hypothetical protein VJ870_14200 [Amycolatopsis sp.]|nr:hypothetical protein [Amycolatopsis sp.]
MYLPPAFAAAVMQQDQRGTLEGPADPALVRSELRDRLPVPVERVAHVGLPSFPIRGVRWDRVPDGPPAAPTSMAVLGSILNTAAFASRLPVAFAVLGLAVTIAVAVAVCGNRPARVAGRVREDEPG